jgi:hypothetical protein
MPLRNEEPLDDLLVHARALFGEEPIEDNENIIYGPLTLSVAPKASLSSPAASSIHAELYRKAKLVIFPRCARC